MAKQWGTHLPCIPHCQVCPPLYFFDSR
jgi:hypothetical protein